MIMINNSQDAGLAFEQEFCKLLRDAGFWVHRIAGTDAGQPFDVIAARHGRVYAFECKVCGKGFRFPLSRVENNQVTAMQTFINAGNAQSCWFVFKRQSGIWLTPAVEVVEILTERQRAGEPEGTILAGKMMWGEWLIRNL